MKTTISPVVTVLRLLAVALIGCATAHAASSPPVITAISPNNIQAEGGIPLTFTGSGFSDATSAVVGGVEVMDLQVIDDHTLVVITSADMNAYAPEVSVTTPAGTRTVSGLLTMDPVQQGMPSPAPFDVYTDPGAFQTALSGGTSLTLPVQAPASGTTQDVSPSYSIGSAGYSATSLTLYHDGYYGNMNYVGAEGSSLGVAISGGYTAVQFYIASFSHPADHFTFSVNGGPASAPFQINGEPLASFIGIQSTVPITSLLIANLDHPGSEIDILPYNPAAIYSIDTGLAVANAQAQGLISGIQSMIGNVNGHLFGLMAGEGEEDANDGIGANLDYGVVLGQGDGPEKNPIAQKVQRSRQWQVFTTVNYGNASLRPINNQAGVQVDSWSPSIGIERHLTRSLTHGIAVSFLHSTQGYTGGLGSMRLEGPAFSTYFAYARKNFWGSLLYNFGTYDLDSTRNPGFGFAQAQGSTRAYTNAVQYNTGWNFRFQQNTLVTGPFAGIDYLHGSINAYSENGGGLAALRYGRQSFDSLVARVGWSASKKLTTDWAVITPQVRLSYERQNLQNNNGTSVSLINAPFGATGGGQSPGQSYMVAGAGVNFQFNDQLSLMLNYQGQLLRENMQAHFASVRLGYSF